MELAKTDRLYWEILKFFLPPYFNTLIERPKLNSVDRIGWLVPTYHIYSTNNLFYQSYRKKIKISCNIERERAEKKEDVGLWWSGYIKYSEEKGSQSWDRLQREGLYNISGWWQSIFSKINTYTPTQHSKAFSLYFLTFY